MCNVFLNFFRFFPAAAQECGHGGKKADRFQWHFDTEVQGFPDSQTGNSNGR